MKKYKLLVNSAKVSGTHTDFPAYVDLSNMPTSFWDIVSNGGGDIRCYSDEALNTQIPREVVTCDISTDTGELRVKTWLSTTTTVYITVDWVSTEPTASSTYWSENTWNSNYKAVYHMQDANDSTSNGNDWTVSGATSGATWQIWDAYDFDWTDDTILVPVSDSLKPTSALTVQMWFERTGTQVNYAKLLWMSQNDSPLYWPYWFQFNSTDDTDIVFRIVTTAAAVAETWAIIQANTLYKIEWVYNWSTSKVFVNDSEKDSTSVSGSISDYDTTNWLAIWCRYQDWIQNFNGIIDETRILDIALSSDWRTTEYNNQSDVDTFWTISEVSRNTKPFLLFSRTR